MNQIQKNDELGIANLKVMMSFMVALANSIGRALEDGDVSMWDLRYLLDPAMLAVPAFKNAAQAAKEFDDMTDDEKEEIYEHIEDEFDLDFDGAEEYIEKGLKAAVALGDLICDTIERYNNMHCDPESHE